MGTGGNNVPNNHHGGDEIPNCLYRPPNKRVRYTDRVYHSCIKWYNGVTKCPGLGVGDFSKIV